MIVLAAVALAVVIYLGASWRQAPIPGDPAALRSSGEELVGAPRRVLVIAAHPDDVEWYVGGTLLRMTAAGSHVTLLVATDGERGRGRDQYTDLAAVRREEQAEAARRLGCADVISLGLPDMRLRLSGDLLPLVRELFAHLGAAQHAGTDIVQERPGLASARQPGVYGQEPVTLVVPDPADSDFRAAEVGVFRERLGVGPPPADNDTELNNDQAPPGRARENEIWPYLAGALLLVLFLENTIADRGRT